MRKRYGAGSIRKKGDGLQVRISLGIVDGKRVQKSIKAKTMAEAHKILAQHTLGTKRQTGTGERVSDFFERWLKDHVAQTQRDATLANHEGNYRLHIKPVIGHRLLVDIGPGDIDNLLDGVRPSPSKPYSDGRSLRHNVRLTLGAAWKWAVKSQRIAGVENVVIMTYGRPLPAREYTWLDGEQIRAFLDAVVGDENEAFFVVAVLCGLRYSELRGLRWRDVQLRGTKPQLTVTKQLDQRGLRDLKTKKSRRVIALDPYVVKVLDAHRKAQAGQQQAAHDAAAMWLDQHGGLVLTGALGTPLAGTQLRRKFEAIVSKAGLPRIRIHDLRHSCFSYLLSRGVPVHVVSAMAGHSQVSTTLNVYAHYLPAQQHDAVTAAWAAL